MSTIINASTSSGLVQTADTSGVLVLQSNGTSAAGVSGSNFQCNSGYGSVATAYGCRAWVNFNGVAATPTIRSSGNVSSLTDRGVGLYTVNFTNALPDANYSMEGVGDWTSGTRTINVTFDNPATNIPSSSACPIATMDGTTARDALYACVSFHR